MNVGEPIRENYSTELVKREEVENSPFEIITIKNKGSFLALGKFRLSPTFEESKDVRNYLLNNVWEIVLDLCIVVAESHSKMEKEDKQTNSL